MRAQGLLLVVALVLTSACAGDDAAEPAATTSTTPTTATTTTAPAERYPDHAADLYAGTTNWICHPDRADDPCRDLRTTVVEPDGSRRIEELTPAAGPAFDCFYVYPTTSTDPELNSDLVPDASEIDTVRAQFARYASVCRAFAPVYRSITLSGLGRGGFASDAREVAYADVVDAWRTYIDDLGDGRGVVLIGHSQGAGHLTRLLEEEVAPRPELRSLLVSAVILGSSVAEGSLPGIPSCTSADEAGCLISFSSYAAAEPPADGAIFGREAVCVDPASLAGGDGLADAVIPSAVTLLGGVEGFAGIDTPYIALPAALRTACETTGAYTYLAVSPTGIEDARPLGPLLVQRLGPAWGLHLLDGNLAQDDLIEVVARQARAHAEA